MRFPRPSVVSSVRLSTRNPQHGWSSLLQCCCGRKPQPRTLPTFALQVLVVFALLITSTALANESPALDELLRQAREQGTIPADQQQAAVDTLNGAAESLPPGVFMQQLQQLRAFRRDNHYPSPTRPLAKDQLLDRELVTLEVKTLRKLPADAVPAHPCAADFPGAIADETPRITQSVEIVTDRPGWHNGGIYGNPNSPYWHSTGVYAAPGEVITVTVPESVADQGLAVRIGCHSDGIWRRDKWQRAPEITSVYPIKSANTKAACAFGGLVYILSPRELSLPEFTADISNVVAAPRYVLGKTELDVWQTTLRAAPAPWAELQGDKVILSLPSETIRKLDDPKSLMQFWDAIMDQYALLLGRPTQRRRIERFVSDIQISAGYMHSGYPLMTMLDITDTMVDQQRIQKNGHHGVWGLFHEIGHNHQHRDWTFGGTTEVTVNLFSLYVMEQICGLPLGGHPSVRSTSRQKARERYFAGECDFTQWKSSPFLALDMYIQLQQAFGWDAFTKVFTRYRELPPEQHPRNDDQKRDLWLTMFSRTVDRDLGAFFEAWGVPTSQSARDSIAELPDWLPEDLPTTSRS